MPCILTDDMSRPAHFEHAVWHAMQVTASQRGTSQTCKFSKPCISHGGSVSIIRFKWRRSFLEYIDHLFRTFSAGLPMLFPKRVRRYLEVAVCHAWFREKVVAAEATDTSRYPLDHRIHIQWRLRHRRAILMRTRSVYTSVCRAHAIRCEAGTRMIYHGSAAAFADRLYGLAWGT